MRVLLALLLVGLSADAAAAETRLERMERLTEALQERLYSGLPGGLPDTVDLDKIAWTDAMRDANACVLSEYAARTSDRDIDAMLDRMEALAHEPVGEFRKMSDEMEAAEIGLPPDEAIQIDKDCGVIDLETTRMREAGIMGAMKAAFSE